MIEIIVLLSTMFFLGLICGSTKLRLWVGFQEKQTKPSRNTVNSVKKRNIAA